MSGCAGYEGFSDLTNAEQDKKTQGAHKLSTSYLAQNNVSSPEPDLTKKTETTETTEQVLLNQPAITQVKNLKPLLRGKVQLRKSEQLFSNFSSQATLAVAVNDMPILDFLHYAFGELLKINYIIDKDLNTKGQGITLNIQEKISPRRLMQLTYELLSKRQVDIEFNDDLYFIHKVKVSKKGRNIVTAVGRELSDVPVSGQDILQIVPIKYGIKISIEKALRQFVGVQISADADQSALFIQGKRDDILRSLEFIHLLDAPANRGRHIGLIELTYIESDEFTKQITTLMQNEGIPVATNRSQGRNLVMVPIAQIGAVAVFAVDEPLLNRIRYWASVIDKPQQSISKQYFLYHPQFARASDLGDSLSALLGGMKGSRTSANKASTGAAPSNKRLTGLSSEDMTLVVDERANAIIFYTSGSEYQALLPLIEKLDVLPKQVMLDITIAEVTLTDEFKQGVEWALTNDNVAMTTKDAFGVTGIGGFSLAVTGSNASLDANFFETNDLVKVLSNPTLLVRDGVSANINVGSEISVIGSTSVDPDGNRQTTASEYRETGVNISVLPSINAQGIVIMEINQEISNSVPDSSGTGGNPDIFKRSLQTEVVAESGQTIILGGLISENDNQGTKKTPLLSTIPLLGHLFKAKGDSSTRTELIMLITPQVIDRVDQWQSFSEAFLQELNFFSFGEQAKSEQAQKTAEP
jgi:general secretion pathway protein D